MGRILDPLPFLRFLLILLAVKVPHFERCVNLARISVSISSFNKTIEKKLILCFKEH
jgi:hypothetical protein